VTDLSWQVSTSLLGLAWFAAINLVVSVVVWFVSRRCHDSLTADPWRARRLLALRLAPAFVSLAVVAVLFMPAHLWLEPAKADERIGFVPMILAVSGLALLLRIRRRRADQNAAHRHGSGEEKPGQEQSEHRVPPPCLRQEGKG